jgi:hypothetical protein
MIAASVNQHENHTSILHSRRRSSIASVTSNVNSREKTSIGIDEDENCPNADFWNKLKSSASERRMIDSDNSGPSSSNAARTSVHSMESRSYNSEGNNSNPPQRLNRETISTSGSLLTTKKITFTTLEKVSLLLTGVISPSSRMKLIWDLIVGVIIIFSVVIIPWKISFNVPSTTAWIFLDFFVDGIFLLDMIITFNTGYYEDLANEIYISDRTLIAKHYLKSWFFIDFISTIPFDYLANLISSGSIIAKREDGVGMELRLTKIVRGLRLFRLARLVTMTVKVQRLHKAANQQYDINPAVIPLIKMIGVIMYGLHVLGCGWYFVCTLEEEQMRVNWVGKVKAGYPFDHVDGSSWDENWVIWYVYSYYWAASTMFAVGYGDIHPVNSSERMYALITQVVGAMVYGYIIGTISYLTEVANPRASALQKRTDELKDWMSIRRLPRSIRYQIISHMKYVWNFRSLYNENMVLGNLSGDLRRRLVFQSYEQVIMTVCLLRWKGVDGRMIELIATTGKPQLLKVGDYLVRKGDIVHGVYVVRNGHVHGLKCDDIKEYGNYVDSENQSDDQKKNTLEVGSKIEQQPAGSPMVYQRTSRTSSSLEGVANSNTNANINTATSKTMPSSPHTERVRRSTSIGMGLGKRINRLVFVVESGHTVLEADVLKENESHSHSYHCIATSICDLMLIPKSTIYNIRSSYPEFFRKFRNIAIHRKDLIEKVVNGNLDPLGRGPSNLVVNDDIVESSSKKHIEHIQQISQLDKKLANGQLSVRGRRDSFRVVATSKSITSLKEKLRKEKDESLAGRQLKHNVIHKVKLKRPNFFKNLEEGNSNNNEQDSNSKKKEMKRKDEATVATDNENSSSKNEKHDDDSNDKEEEEKNSNAADINSPQELLYLWIIHPTLSTKMCWDVFVAILILYSVIVIPCKGG